MRRWTAAFLIVVACATGGCGGKKKTREGHGTAEPSAPAVAPTPDTTPIEVLRTPAGLVLKTSGQTPAAVTPTPSADATPGPGKAGS
jgi:hypothetical protein